MKTNKKNAIHNLRDGLISHYSNLLPSYDSASKMVDTILEKDKSERLALIIEKSKELDRSSTPPNTTILNEECIWFGLYTDSNDIKMVAMDGTVIPLIEDNQLFKEIEKWGKSLSDYLYAYSMKVSLSESRESKKYKYRASSIYPSHSSGFYQGIIDRSLKNIRESEMKSMRTRGSNK